MFDVQCLSQCGSTSDCPSRDIPEIHFSCCRGIKEAKDRLVGLVVMASGLRMEDLGFDSGLHHGEFSGSSYQ